MSLTKLIAQRHIHSLQFPKTALLCVERFKLSIVKFTNGVIG